MANTDPSGSAVSSSASDQDVPKDDNSDTIDSKETEQDDEAQPTNHNNAPDETVDSNRESSAVVHAGKNEFSLSFDVSRELGKATKRVASYGVHIFSDSMEYTKRLLLLQQHRHQIHDSHHSDVDGGGEIDPHYEVIDESLKHVIPTDKDHSEGQAMLMRSDTRIQQRITDLLIAMHVELPIQEWTWFDIFVTGLLKCGTIKVINYLDRDLLGKLLLGFCWVFPAFVQHFFDTDMQRFVYPIVIHVHSTVCLLMVAFAAYDICTSLTKYDWKKAVLCSSMLIVFAVTFYLLFYSGNVLNTALCVALVPLCWRFMKTKAALSGAYALFTKHKLIQIYNEKHPQEQELYMNETEFVVNSAHGITQEIYRKAKRRRYCSFAMLLILWLCFVVKLVGHINYMMSDVHLHNMFTDWIPITMTSETKNDLRHGSGCEPEDVLCNWLVNDLQIGDEYMHVFREHGFDNMETICTLNERNLEAMSIHKQGHINQFMLYVKSQSCQTCDTSAVD